MGSLTSGVRASTSRHRFKLKRLHYLNLDAFVKASNIYSRMKPAKGKGHCWVSVNKELDSGTVSRVIYRCSWKIVPIIWREFFVACEMEGGTQRRDYVLGRQLVSSKESFNSRFPGLYRLSSLYFHTIAHFVLNPSLASRAAIGFEVLEMFKQLRDN